MDKENFIYINMYIGEILLSHKENQNYVIFRKLDGTEAHHAERNKPSSKGQISQVLSRWWNLDLK
jgi:hypothetical protein